ncbi:TRAP transporter small permease [Halobacillus sp. BBL2006]|uniref:TRAP transporter small permease n=1 Tax=Halobacillus sp. BBL2006 TaxID=1543706 RepID=UPI001E60D9AA|nr:TRAP transporter small permease [Halobacillus sp. BBL2006]
MLDKITARFVKLTEIIAILLMVLLTLVVFAEVLSRYVFNYPISFSTELTQLFFPWMIFLGTVAVTKNEEHLKITVLQERFGRGVQLILQLFAKVVMLLFSIYMVYASYLLAQAVRLQPLPMLQISKSWLYVSVTVSFTIVALLLVLQIILLISRRKIWMEGGEIQ